MKTIQGPAVFLAQFLGDTEPFNSLDSIAKYMADLGYKGIQLPTWDPRVIDLKKAAESTTYCDELKGKLKDIGLKLPNCRPTFRDNWLPFIRLIAPCSTVLARLSWRANPKNSRSGPFSN
jgi:sugar phosphate isomerase/epimerase